MMGSPWRLVPAPARDVAGRLAAMFERDRELVLALNDAQHRLRAANDRLTASLSAKALRAIHGPQRPDIGPSGPRPAVLEAQHPISALEKVADTIRRAFIDYQNAVEERRQLAFDIGDANAQLVAAMTAAGFTHSEVRSAEVQALAKGVYRPAMQQRSARAPPATGS